MAPGHKNPEHAKATACDHDKQRELVQCDACLTQVPLSVAKSVEGLDYVHHFCGLDCLEKWLEQAKTNVGDSR